MRYQNKPQESSTKKEKPKSSTGGGYNPVGWTDIELGKNERGVDVKPDKEDKKALKKKQQKERAEELTFTDKDEERWKANRERTLKNRRDNERKFVGVPDEDLLDDAVDAVIDAMLPDLDQLSDAVSNAANALGEDNHDRHKKGFDKKAKHDSEDRRIEEKRQRAEDKEEKKRLKKEEKAQKRALEREKELERREKKKEKRRSAIEQKDKEIKKNNPDHDDDKKKKGKKRVNWSRFKPDPERIKEDLLFRYKMHHIVGAELDEKFDSVRDQLTEQMRNGAFTFDSIRWSDKFRDTYYAHYTGIGSHFGENMQRQLGVTATPDEKKLIDDELKKYYASLSEKRADYTAMNTLNHARESFLETQEEKQIQDDDDFDAEDFADSFDKKLKERFDSEVQLTAASETQRAAEAAKYVEAQILDAGKTNINNRGLRIQAKNTKHWHTSGCSQERESHVQAGETQKDIELHEYFHVGDSLMLFPTDHVTNPSELETAQCQCTVIYNLTDDQIKKRQA